MPALEQRAVDSCFIQYQLIVSQDHMIRRIIDVIYVVSSIIGAGLVALNINEQRIGYISYLISSIAAMWLLSKSNASKSIMLVTIVFSIINVVGLIRS